MGDSLAIVIAPEFAKLSDYLRCHGQLIGEFVLVDGDRKAVTLTLGSFPSNTSNRRGMVG